MFVQLLKCFGVVVCVYVSKHLLAGKVHGYNNKLVKAVIIVLVLYITGLLC